MGKQNLGILLRVSSDVQQNEGGGLDVQKTMGLEMSKKLGLKPIIFNEGSQSSFNVNIEQRIVLVELLDEISKGNITNIWVFNSDRLGRSSQSWYSIYKVLLDYGVNVFVGTSPKPYNLDFPMDEFQMGILSLVSQYDNKLRRMRSVLGKRSSLKNGNTFVGGTKPFGYDVKNKKLVINKEESECVKKVYKMYRDGKSTMEIKTYLDIKTDFEPKRSKSGWNLGTIQKMLGSTLYKGFQKWKWKELVSGKPIVVDTILLKTPKIIPNKLWDEVQHKLLENLRVRSNEKTYRSLLDNIIYCKSCGVKLSSREGVSNPLYSCRSVEYKWKNNSKWGNKHLNCTLKKSLRIQSTDSEILNHIISIIKESKRVRENFKVKTLSPKFDEVKNIKKEKDKRVKYIKEKNKIHKGYSDNVIDIEVDILTNKIDRDKGKKMITKISDMMNEVSSDINRLERELTIYENSTHWMDWLNQMYLEIDSVQSYDLDKKQKFLNDYINKIDVEYLSKIQSHKFDFEFKYPIVEDKLINDGLDKGGKRKYQIDKGLNTSSLTLQIPHNHKSKLSESEKDELNRVISKFRVEDSLSLNEISKRLNDKGYRTLTNKLWNKSTLSLYIKRMKVDVGK